MKENEKENNNVKVSEGEADKKKGDINETTKSEERGDPTAE
jgi:hypothetical protein